MPVNSSSRPTSPTAERAWIAAQLRDALANDALVIHYQPLACLESGSIIGFEALARWAHPEFGVIEPSVFVPVAEEAGLIGQLGEWVLREACREAVKWGKPLRIAVNLSPLQVVGGRIVATLDRLLAETGLAPDRLDLEVTEGMLLEDSESVLATLRELKKRGVRIVMDDFGTGYSSLNYFRKFAFDNVKVDRSFIQDMATNAQSMAIVRAIIALAEALGLSVTAEGVETQAQAELLGLEGCRQMQGYFVGRAGPISEFERAALNRVPGVHGCFDDCRRCLHRLRHIELGDDQLIVNG